MKPLHAQVAEALGWTHIGPGNSMNLGDPGVGYPPATPIVGHKEPLPRYDLDWSATGPLIERYRIKIEGQHLPVWHAWLNETAHGGDHAEGETPLLAVCKLILKLTEAGRL